MRVRVLAGFAGYKGKDACKGGPWGLGDGVVGSTGGGYAEELDSLEFAFPNGLCVRESDTGDGDAILWVRNSSRERVVRFAWLRYFFVFLIDKDMCAALSLALFGK